MIKNITLYKLTLTLKVPFTTSFGTELANNRVFISIEDDEGNKGLGEVPTLNDPSYKPESDYPSVVVSLENFIIPSIIKAGKVNPINSIIKLKAAYDWIKGADFAKSGVEAAFWHLLSLRSGKRMDKLLGGKKKSVVSGVSIGGKTMKDVLERASLAIDNGFPRLKVKIWPGFDIEPVRILRKKYPEIMLQVDANSAYKPKNWNSLKKLDNYNLLLIEQPLAHDDIVDHSELSKRLKTPICLDESIHSYNDARKAIFLWKQNKLLNRLIVNIKPPRVSGYSEAIDIAKLCRENNISTWCGGMLDSGWGKYMNICFSSREELNLPGDHFSPTGNYFKKDILINNLTSREGVYHLEEIPQIDWKALKSLTKAKRSYKLI